MERDSQEEDATLRDYWTKKKEKKKEKEKKKRAKTRRHRRNIKEACLTLLSSPPLPLLMRELLTSHSLQRKYQPQHITIQTTTYWILTISNRKPLLPSHQFNPRKMEM